MIPRLGDAPDAPFPAPDEALEHPDGLLAWGGSLEPNRLINAYRLGIFPWYSGSDPILWWSPSERCVLRTGHVHVSRRLARRLRQGRFSITMDHAFSEVVEGCAQTREATWITPEMAQAYARLHRLGIAHSIEAWLDGELAGGLYGLSLGRMFFGESMFSQVSDASKVVLVRLCQALACWDYPLLDCQVHNDHLERMGAETWSRDRYLARLAQLVTYPDTPGQWTDRFRETADVNSGA